MPAATAARDVPRRVRWVIWSSVPIAFGAIAASLAGLLLPGTYAEETASWAAQGAGQDAANLVIYPLMLLFAWLALRGSLHAYLAWLGIAAYTVYSYLLYAGYLHLSGWFLVYVVVFGLSAWALILGSAMLDPVRVRAVFAPSAPTRTVGWVLAVLGAMFALLWLSEIVPALLGGTVPGTITEAGQITNPVWLLDLGLVLPAMIAIGLLLRRGRAVGFVFAAPLLTFGVVMGAAIVGMFAMLSIRGELVATLPVVMISITVLAEAGAVWWFLAKLPTDVRLGQVTRRPTGEAAEPDRADERVRELLGAP